MSTGEDTAGDAGASTGREGRRAPRSVFRWLATSPTWSASIAWVALWTLLVGVITDQAVRLMWTDDGLTRALLMLLAPAHAAPVSVLALVGTTDRPMRVVVLASVMAALAVVLVYGPLGFAVSIAVPAVLVLAVVVRRWVAAADR